MTAVSLKLPRVEGGMHLVQEESGTIRLAVPPPRNIEGLLAGRSPQDAVFLTQQVSADSGISHALAAVMAWEAAAEVSVAPNGLIVRDLLHTLSLLHGHLRNFYFQALADYVPPSAMAGYKGGMPALRAIAQAMGERNTRSWARYRFAHPFTAAELNRLLENQQRAQRALYLLQRMMAMLGGKFPMVMSIVPGGVTIELSEATVLRLRAYLEEVGGLVRDAPLEDGLLVVQRHDDIKLVGRGEEAMISAGTLGDDSGPAASLFPKGVWVARTLEPLQPRVSENISAAFYRVATHANGSYSVLEFAPQKEGAYTWIKAPRYLDRAMETGALARLVITQQGGSRTYAVETVRHIEALLRQPLQRANTIGGRLLARVGEVKPLLDRCETLLAQFTPGQPTVTAAEEPPAVTGEATGRIEAPAGMVQHRLVLEKGRVAHAEIISPSTWNGAPRDEKTPASGLEHALNVASLDLRGQADQLMASRIVCSYFFSATDAVQ